MVCKVCQRRKDRCGHNAGSELCAKHGKRKQRCQECHPALAMAQKIRDQCRSVLRQARALKNESSATMLGCTVHEFRIFIDRKIAWWNARYKPAISWERMHLDHIKPVHTLRCARPELRGALPEANNIAVIAHYTNIQPLPPEVNLCKRCTWSARDEQLWRDHVCGNAHYSQIFLPAVVWHSVEAVAKDK